MDWLLFKLVAAFDSMPNFAAVFLAVAGFIGCFMPKRAAQLEERPGIRRTIAIVAIVIGALAFWSSEKQGAANKNQIETLLANSKIAATHDDIASLRDAITSGFETLKSTLSSSKANPQEKTPPPQKKESSQIQLGPAIVGHVQVSQQRAVSNDPNLPYALQVIVQTDQPIQPIHFQFTCDGEIGGVEFFLAGQSVYFSKRWGVTGENHNIADIGLGFPAMTATSSLVVTILSKTNLRVTAVNRLQQ